MSWFLVALGGATLLATWRWQHGRRRISAIGEALLSLSERDYSVRLVDDPALGETAKRFNRLGERLRAEHSERYQREILLETVLEATPSAVLLIDAEDQVVFANAAAGELLCAGERVVGRRLSEVIERAPRELQAALREGTEGLVTVEASEAPETYHVASRALELRFRPHRLLLVKPLTRDLVRKEAEGWKRAIRVMSHELNNALGPIGSLVNTARTIADKPEHAGKLTEAFDTIAERTQHLRRFLDGYAEFARLPLPVRQPLRWRALLDQLHALYPFAPSSEISEREARLDPTQIQQVLVNLVKNALESGSKSEDVHVRVRGIDGGHVVEVSDAGAGVSEDALKHVLVPFYSTKKTGTGLGLPLCREIVEAHGGHLRIESQLGRGTTVRCYLPDA